MTNGYNFYFKDGEDVLTFPITPSELSISVGSKNKVVTLINEGDINILKSPSLIEVEFEAIFPMRQYPYAREFSDFETYFDKFTDLKENKRPFRFIVARTMPGGTRTWDTNLLVALEEFKLTENANNGDDVLIKFQLKQFKEYGVKRLIDDKSQSTSTATVARPSESKAALPTTHVVIKTDTLWGIAKKYYSDAKKWKALYAANKTAIEEDAKKHNMASSRNGHFIFPGLTLQIPVL